MSGEPKSRARREKKLAHFCLPWILFGLPLFSVAGARAAEPVYRELAERLTRKGMEDGYAYSLLRKLTRLGPRLTGSPQAAAAVALMRREMQDLGLENVRLEPTLVGRWVRGEAEEAWLTSSLLGRIRLSICSLGGSTATPGDGLTAPVIEVKSLEELRALGTQARGKVVFFNRAMDPGRVDTFQAYGEAAWQRVNGADEAAKGGGVAALVRSLNFGEDDFPHTGLVRYDPGAPKVPAVCVSTQGANLLSRALRGDPGVSVHIRTSCRTLSPVTSYNVVGEIRGHKFPREIILLGAHLDSWDLGQGAHDDGAGCAHILDALRLLKAIGLKPKRTVRGVLFMDEENGGTGGRDYARSSLRQGEVHIAAIESDRGGFQPLGMGVGKRALDKVRTWESLFQPLGIGWIREGGGGVDVAPLAESGAVLMSVIPDSQRYYDAHHCSRDVLEAVHPRELELGAVATAILALLLSEEGI